MDSLVIFSARLQLVWHQIQIPAWICDIAEHQKYAINIGNVCRGTSLGVISVCHLKSSRRC